MNAKEFFRLPDPRDEVRIEAKEIVRDLFGKPHVFVRIRLTGWHFPHRAQEPFALVGEVASRMVLIDQDEQGANCYFDHDLPRTEIISFGYGKTILWDFNLPGGVFTIPRLERSRLPKERVDPFHPLEIQ